jgi:hypothetical protein
MTSQKRDELLTQLERDRLVSRNRKTIAANDARVQRKLSAWLRNVPDVLSVLKHLPEDQKRAVLCDADIFAILELAERMLAIKEFRSIYGDFRAPANWGATDTCGDSRPYRCDPKSLQPAKDIDISRSLALAAHIEKLQGFLGANNPITQYALTEQLVADPRFDTHITEGDRAGLARVRQAIERCPAGYTTSPKKIDLNQMVNIEQPPK